MKEGGTVSEEGNVRLRDGQEDLLCAEVVTSSERDGPSGGKVPRRTKQKKIIEHSGGIGGVLSERDWGITHMWGGWFQ